MGGDEDEALGGGLQVVGGAVVGGGPPGRVVVVVGEDPNVVRAVHVQIICLENRKEKKRLWCLFYLKKSLFIQKILIKQKSFSSNVLQKSLYTLSN